ncbi:MAG: hypothetical protein M9952_10100 [Microthrixaceae bacterium]|nr:hypothetical protein [Microthrixaceae bacterium]MCO5313267.1 hypothetical protein [Microthrixaceae bacterium]
MGIQKTTSGYVLVPFLVILGAGCGEARHSPGLASEKAAEVALATEEVREDAIVDMIEDGVVLLPVYRDRASIKDLSDDQRVDIAVESFGLWRAQSLEQIANGLPTDEEALETMAKSFGVGVETMSRFLDEGGRQVAASGIPVPAPSELFDVIWTPIYSEPVIFCDVPSAVSLFLASKGEPAILKSEVMSERVEVINDVGADGGRVWVSQNPSKGFRTISWVPTADSRISVSLTTSAECTAADAVASITVQEVNP